MKVSDQMNTQPLTVTSGDSVGSLAKAMTEARTTRALVLDTNGALLGIITATDLVAKHARLHFPTYFSLLGFSVPVESRRGDREIEQALARTAGELMSTALVTVPPDADIDDAATLMLDHEISCLPVVQGGLLVGTIDEADIVRLLVIEEAD